MLVLKVLLILSTIHTRTIFTYDIHNVLYDCRGCNLRHTICREVITHASRAQ